MPRHVLDGVEIITSTATTLATYGTSFITGAATTSDKTYTLPVPAIAGQHKHIIVKTTQAAKVTVRIGTSTAAGFLYGLSAASTLRQIVFSTQTTKVRAVHLIANTTAQWGVASKTTAVTFIA